MSRTGVGCGTRCGTGSGRGRGTVIRDAYINRLNTTLHVACVLRFEDVEYHLDLRTDGDPVGGCVRDFQHWYNVGTWQMAQDLLGGRSSAGEGKNYPAHSDRGTRNGVYLGKFLKKKVRGAQDPDRTRSLWVSFGPV
ncbi:hypothetical protein PIB30_095332 [Stylosanthes scabra]|uniref:Uncharacterized protein n=1 Tax=Stylosanthes scabra TaxID=79078 RepID=A0ABU6VVK5_9FABA|nr:hypothetical protein [Stylosanthes scabra]